ncbi:MAG: caspase family protein [Chloroflexota bacterium]
MSNETPTMYALMVAVDDYKADSVPDLGGCVNDVNAMEQLLVNKFGLAQENVVKLLDSQATHAAIKESFRSHLIGNAQAWAEAGSPEPKPAFYFHYSGHGSQAVDPTGTKPDGMDETTIPHDSRTDGVYDIKDWELGEMLEELTHYSDNVTVFMDCCHSGSGTRKVKPGMIPTRRANPDLRPQPTGKAADATAGNEFGVGKRSLKADGEAPEDRYVLLASCRDTEEANEYRVPEGNSFRQHGVTTYFVVEELSKMSPDRPLTYRELHERVRQKVHSQYSSQMPQCEGDRDREVFGGLRPRRDVMLTVVEIDDETIWVDGGVAHGLTEGSQLHVYPPDTRKIADAGPPIATLSVEEVGAVRSGCVIEEVAEKGTDEIEPLSKATIYRINHGEMQREVHIDVADAELAAKVKSLLTTAPVEPYVKLVSAESAAQFSVAQVDAPNTPDGMQVEIQNPAGERLVAPFPLDKLHELPNDLTHIVRYHNALALENTDPYGELAGTFKVAMKKLAFDEETAEPIAVDFDEQHGGELVATEGDRLVIEVTNLSDLDLYFTILFFDHDWSITKLYPPVGAHERLEAGYAYSLGCSRKRRDQLLASLPKQLQETHQRVKVIATVDDADFELLEQKALKSPWVASRSVLQTGNAFSKLMHQTMGGGKKRALGPPPTAVEDEWTTAQIEYRLVRK